MSEEVEPDAWQYFDKDWPYEVEKEPLFSAETIQDKVRFEQQARELDGLARRMEAALSKPIDRESMLELVQDLYSKADELAEVGEVFSRDE